MRREASGLGCSTHSRRAPQPLRHLQQVCTRQPVLYRSSSLISRGCHPRPWVRVRYSHFLNLLAHRPWSRTPARRPRRWPCSARTPSVCHSGHEPRTSRPQTGLLLTRLSLPWTGSAALELRTLRAENATLKDGLAQQPAAPPPPTPAAHPTTAATAGRGARGGGRRGGTGTYQPPLGVPAYGDRSYGGGGSAAWRSLESRDGPAPRAPPRGSGGGGGARSGGGGGGNAGGGGGVVSVHTPLGLGRPSPGPSPRTPTPTLALARPSTR